MGRLKIVNETGNNQHTKVIDIETGEEIKGVADIIIHPMTANKEPSPLMATINVRVEEIDINAEQFIGHDPNGLNSPDLSSSFCIWHRQPTSDYSTYNVWQTDCGKETFHMDKASERCPYCDKIIIERAVPDQKGG